MKDAQQAASQHNIITGALDWVGVRTGACNERNGAQRIQKKNFSRAKRPIQTPAEGRSALLATLSATVGYPVGYCAVQSMFDVLS